MNRRAESAWIFSIHGPADAITTIAAARAVGIDVEANPIVRQLLSAGELPTAIVMCACVAVAAVAWPIAADAIDAPPAAAIAISLVGIAVVAGNLVVAL